MSGVAREGVALLQGLLLCGKCGRRLVVRYRGFTARENRQGSARQVQATIFAPTRPPLGVEKPLRALRGCCPPGTCDATCASPRKKLGARHVGTVAYFSRAGVVGFSRAAKTTRQVDVRQRLELQGDDVSSAAIDSVSKT